MKRLRILSLLLLLALLLAACGRRAEEALPEEEAPPAEEPAPEAAAPENVPEGAAPLTAEEIGRVNEAFEAVWEEDGLAYANPICCFFTSYYQRPEEIDLSEFLRHFSPGVELSGEEEFQALKAAEGWPFGRTGWDTWEQMRTPVHRYLRSDVDASLMEHAGIATADLTGVNAGNTSLMYLPKYDAYYNFVSDFDPGWFQCESGWYTDKEARLTGGDRVLTLRKDADRWLFQSFLSLKAE